MSIEKYDNDCPGCRPALLDVKTGEVLPDDDPIMVSVNKAWEKLTPMHKQAFHRACCQNSTAASDLEAMNEIASLIKAAVAASDSKLN
jgi:hypothetical protein